MSDTKRQYTKKELVTAEVHRKAGQHKEKDKGPKVCPVCRGSCITLKNFGEWEEVGACSKCKGEGTV